MFEEWVTTRCKGQRYPIYSLLFYSLTFLIATALRPIAGHFLSNKKTALENRFLFLYVMSNQSFGVVCTQVISLILCICLSRVTICIL